MIDSSSPPGGIRLIEIKKAQEQMEAMGMRVRSASIIIGWIKDFNIGRKVGGNWMIFEDRLYAFLKGEKIPGGDDEN